MYTAKGILFQHGMVSKAITLGLCLLFFSCSRNKNVDLSVIVKDKESGAGVPLAEVQMYRFYEGGTLVFLDSLRCDEQGMLSSISVPVEQGFTYKFIASKPYFEGTLSGNGASRANEASIKWDELSNDTVYLYLRSVLPAANLDRAKQAVLNVNELIGGLKSGNWTGNFIPRLAWGDIPTLLESGGDTSVIKHFPMKTGSSLQPDSARLGQVALWMVEAIRRDVSRKATDKPVFLMPPSNVPVLGTRRGNPRLFNSKGALEKAYNAYLKWWEKGSVEDTLRKARRNPLRGTGLGWM